MKKRVFFSVLIALVFTLVFSASAHSGRTDSSGGHHDYKNKSGLGSYHYHHGYPAHLHPGGVCPYTSASNKSNSSSSSSSSRKSSSSSSRSTSSVSKKSLPTYKVYVNGEMLDTDPIAADGAIFAPAPLLAEKLGALIDWDGTTNTATLYKDGSSMRFTENSENAYITNATYTGNITFSPCPRMANQCLYLPVRQLAQTIDAAVGWEAESKSVYIKTN